jgi:O-antigen/teichoic acid export membrane protein
MYGRFALLISLFTLCVALVSIGVGDIFGRFVAEFASRGDWENVRKLFANVLALKLSLTLVALCVLVPVLNQLYGERFPFVYFLLLAAAILLADVEGCFFSLLFGLNRLVHFSAREPIRRIVSLGLVLVMFRFYGLVGALAAVVVVELLLVVMAIALTYRHLSFAHFGIDLMFLRPFLKFGVTVYASWLLLTVWQRIGNVLIERGTGDAAQVAVYDVANQLFLVAFSVGMSGVNSLVPIFTRLFVTQQEARLEAWSCRFIKYLTMGNVVLLGGFAFVGEDAVRMFVGAEFREVTPLGITMFWGVFPLSIAQFGFVYSLVYGRPAVYLKALGIGLVALLLLSWLLIPPLRSMGAALASVASCLVMAAVLSFAFRERMLILVRQVAVVMAVAVPAAGLLLFKGTPVENMLLAVVFTAGYAACLVASGCLQIGEIREIHAALRRA